MGTILARPLATEIITRPHFFTGTVWAREKLSIQVNEVPSVVSCVSLPSVG